MAGQADYVSKLGRGICGRPRMSAGEVKNKFRRGLEGSGHNSALHNKMSALISVKLTLLVLKKYHNIVA